MTKSLGYICGDDIVSIVDVYYCLLQNESSPQIVAVKTCIQKWGIPADTKGVRCHPGNHMVVNNTQQTTDKLYFPYPEPGSWYISMLSQCYRNDTANG